MTSTDYTPKHRANKVVRTKPKVQPLGKHVGEYQPEDRTHERLGAAVFDLDAFKQLVGDVTLRNPLRGIR